jgi:RND family efflux transporter MFP subunit
MNRKPLLATFVAAIALAGCKGEAKVEKIQLPPAPPSVTHPPAPTGGAEANAEGGDLATASDGTLRVTGATAPHRMSQVAATGSGLVAALLVREGDVVEKGQVLARLDDGDIRLRLRQAEAQKKLAQVQLSASRRELDRLTKLADDKALPAAQVDQARTAFEAAEAQLALAETTIAMARKAQVDTQIKAPFAGVVVERLTAEGAWVATMPPSPVVALAEITPIDLKIDVPEAHMKSLRVGDKVRARIDAVGEHVEGAITRIVPFVKAGTRSFTVIVELPNADGRIKPGVFAEVEIKPSPAPEGEAQR